MHRTTVTGACFALAGPVACTSSGPTAAGDIRFFPGPDPTAAPGAMLQVLLSREGDGVRVRVTAEPARTALERASRGVPPASADVLPPGACRPRQDRPGLTDLTGRGNTRVPADLRRGRQALLAARDDGSA